MPKRYLKPHLWLIAWISRVVPRRYRSDWRQEWEAELLHRQSRLQQWKRPELISNRDLLKRSAGALWDALWLQPQRLEEDMFQDLSYGARMLLHKPAFTLVALIALALGIGASTAIFSIVNGILLRSLPYSNPDRIVMVWMDNHRLGLDQDWHSYPNYVDYRDQNQSFEQMAAFNDRSFNLTGSADPERVMGMWATASLFQVLGVQPSIGRAFRVEEEEPGKDLVVVISHGLWQRWFGSDPGIIGQQLIMNGTGRTVIGVMPPGVTFPSKDAELWVPLAMGPGGRNNRGGFSLKAIGLLRPAASIAQARADLGTIAGRLEQQYSFLAGYGVNLVPLHDQVVGKIRPALLVLLAAVGFVLLIGCANIANLLLARAATREREIAIRTALGAHRWRLIRQLLTESLLLSLMGGAVGIAVAIVGLKFLISVSPPETPRLDQVTVDARVLLFALVVSLFTGALFGLAPALQSSKPNLNESLKEGGRTSSAGIRGSRVRGLLVISEVALSLVLLIGAGLMIKSFHRLQQVNLGFNPDRLLAMNVRLAGSKYRDGPQAAAFYQQVLQRIEALPGVQSAGAISTIFLSITPNSTIFSIEGRPPVQPAEQIEVPLDSVSPGYFQMMGVSLLRGREFDGSDGKDSPPVVIINDTMARQFWPGEDPVGKRFKFGDSSSDGPWLTIVGVVGDMRRTGFELKERPETFLPISQNPVSSMTFVVRGVSDPMPLAAGVRDQVWAVDHDQPVFDVKSMAKMLADMTSQRRLNMLLLGIFAGSALLLAAVGIYGVVSYAVSQRTHEIGVRLALGAGKGQVLGMVVRQAMLLALIGLVAGSVTSLLSTRLMVSLLYGVSPTDPFTFGSVPILLAAIAFLACYIPARRVTKVDPIKALRYE
jgi:putative ABC transport system permease protein